MAPLKNVINRGRLFFERMAISTDAIIKTAAVKNQLKAGVIEGSGR